MKTSTRHSVIIVGGGIAGLAAARELARHGIGLTLLEATHRLGGRIHTIRHGRLPIELGAEFIHGRSKPLMRALHAAGLAAASAPSSTYLAQDGHLRPVPDFWEAVEGVISRIPMRRPDSSFADFLSRTDIDDSLARWARDFVEGFNAADATQISAHSLLKAQRSAEKMQGDWQGFVRQGYGALISFLEREVRAAGVRLLLGAPVRQIRWRSGSVSVAWQSASGPESSRATAVVLTLPLGVWQANTLAFIPPLPDKRAATRELICGDVCKVTLVFRKRWWPRAGSGFVQAPAERLPTWWSTPGLPVLTAWAGGPRAASLLSSSPHALTKLCLETLARIFSERLSSLRRQFLASYTCNWTADPNFRAAYSYLPVGGLDLPNALAQPVADTLFFAGEATTPDAQMGTVFGAYSSGLRAARQCLHAAFP